MWRKSIALVVFGIAAFLATQSIPRGEVMASQADRLARGRNLFYQHCASCHGMDGRGGGPVAASLKTVTPDLTTIESREGKFDQVRLQNIISGERDIAAHGTKEMPVWGFVFRYKTGSQSVATLNVYAIADYIKAFQRK